MDLKLRNSEVDISGYPTWGVEVSEVETGKFGVPIIYDEEEDGQQATCASFTNLGSIPQLPKVGVPWTGMLTGSVPFATLDSEIVANLQASGHGDYIPIYKNVNDQVQLLIVKGVST